MGAIGIDQSSPVSEEAPPVAAARRAIATGLLAGTIGLGCCVGPAVAALLGITSATFAVDLATDLYNEWGWVFKLAGAGFAGATLYKARREAAACSLDQPGLGRFAATVAITGVATYALLYALTTYLGGLSSQS